MKTGASILVHSVIGKSFLVFLLLFISAPISYALTIEPDGPAQAPVIYVHGYIDDGTSWARDSLYAVEELAPMSIKYLRHYVIGPNRSPSAFLTRNGIENWAVQWWADDGFNTYATADEGYAFLQNSQQLLAGTNWILGTWTAQNRPIPSALEVLQSTEIDIALGLAPIPPSILGLPTSLLVKAGIASQLWIRSTYQDAGRVDPRAEDMLDMLRSERRQGGKLSRYRQTNIITHSMGSLVTRAMLDKAFTASSQDSEFVANVIYNAPPFAGSTMAYLSKIYFEPVLIDSTIFEDERVQLMLGTSVTTAKGLLINFIDLLIRPLGVRFHDIEAGFNPVARSAIDFLLLIPINEVITPSFIQSLSGTNTGEAIAIAMQFARPFVAGLLGVKGAPGHDDLTPEGGVAHITSYTTNPDVKQFVTLGTQGFGVHLFPSDLNAVANDPSLITDNSVIVAQTDDSAVAVGSARLLTTTDNFGSRMDLLGEFPYEHPDLLYRNLPVMGPVWLETLLAPSTRLQVEGDVVVLSSANRNYLVRDASASFQFESDSIQRSLDFPITDLLPFGQTVDISISAVSYEYRLTSDDGASIISDWNSVSPGQLVSFNDLLNANALENRPFYMEWRSVNERGGRELIRSARFVVAGAAPQLVLADILAGNSQQVVKVGRGELIGANAVRGRAFDRILNTTEIAQLISLTAQSEANWIVSQPAGKALTLGFDVSGNLQYAWNDSALLNPQTRNNVAGELITLDTLAEGVHTLYFRTANPLTPTQFSTVQQIRIQVDNTAPRLNFELQQNHPLGVVVSPNTPLYFSIEDYGSNAGSGQLTVAGNADWIFPAGESFSLQQTELKQQMQAVAIVGGDVVLSVSGTDRVGNTRTESYTVYYDITPPELSVLQLTPVILVAGSDDYQLFTDSVDLVLELNDAGSGMSGAAPVLLIAGEVEGYQMSQALTLGGVAGFPTKYGASITLPMGKNRLTIAMQDLAGNTGELSLAIERIDPVVQDADIDIVSTRIDNNTCFNNSGNEVSCNNGAIDQFVSAYNGEVVAFTSTGNRFVRSDSNRSRDVFIWQGNSLTIASRNAAGELADDNSKNPALSGSGRYLLFESEAGNLVTGAQDFNLYIKDLQTGRIAVVSRAPDGSPSNLTLQGGFSVSTTYSGRYVFFSSQRNATYLAAFPNPGTQIYMVDLDPDGNGDYFDDNYVTHPVSNINATTMPSLASQYPKVTLDGRYLVYNSRSDGDLRLLRFSGSDAGGDLDVSIRSEVLIPGSGGSVFDIAPYADDVAFLSVENLLPADTNSALLNSDIYLSQGEVAGGGFFSRSLSLVSSSFSGSASAMDLALPLQDVSVAQDRLAGSNVSKVAWVSSHTNIVNNDSNAVEDLFVARTSDVFPVGLAVTNWISDTLLSSATVRTGALSADGRYAFWVSNQSYAPPYGTDALHLFRRRIDPAQETDLSIAVLGDGTVNLSPPGIEVSPGLYRYSNEQQITVTAVAGVGTELTSWQGDADGNEVSSKLWLTEDKTVTAVFSAIPGPLSASAIIDTQQGQKSDGVTPVISFDGDADFIISIVSQPAQGIASTLGGLLFYQPAQNFIGADSFEFQVTNGRGVSLPFAAVASVQVNAVNRAPLTASLQINVTVNQASALLVPVINDPDIGDSFSFSVLAQPANGSVVVQGSGFIYTPNDGFIGEDSFSYSVTDSAGNSLSATANVTVSQAGIEIPITDNNNADTGGSGGGALAWGLWILLPLLLRNRRLFRNILTR